MIDVSTQTLFAVAKTKELNGGNPIYKYTLHALDLRDGSEKNAGPIEIKGQVSGGAGSVAFDPFLALNRTALLLLSNRVYVAFASQGDVEDKASRPFHGWIFSYNANNLAAPPWLFCTSPTSSQAGIWQSGGGLAADVNGRLLAVTGNGPNVPGSYGNSVLNFSTAAGLELKDWFTPNNSDFLNRWDLDLGSSGPMIVPERDFKDLVVTGGKDGMLYLLHRSSLGHGHGYPYYNNHAPNLYESHPWVLAVRADGTAYGVLADTTREVTIDTTSNIMFRSDTTFPVIVIDRGSPQDVLRELAKLTGYMPMPPKWAIGYHQSHFSYTPELEVLDIAARARQARTPIDAVYMDIDYMDHYRIFSFSPQTFADAKDLNDDLADLGLHNVWMIDPAVRAEKSVGVTRVYDSGMAQDVWVKLADGKTPYHGSQWPEQDPDKTMRTFSLFPDFTSPAVRTWWSGQFKDFLAKGVDGVWNDMNEPAVFVDQPHTMPDSNRHAGDPSLPNYAGQQPQGVARASGSHVRYHNVYGMLMAESTRTAIAGAAPNRRPFVLARANFIGGQRFAAAWTGDNTANWEHLRMSIPMILNLGLSGQPFAGADIGGYRYSKDEKPPLTKEDDGKLFARWLGIGALYPFSRAHYERNFGPPGVAPPGWRREPWAYPSDLVESNRRAIERRYRLLPYLYTVFYEASTTGLPVMRPLFFADPKDPQLREADESFLLGDDVLVAAQVDPTVVKVPRLPAGMWHKFGIPADDEKTGTDIDEPNLPGLYLRGGAIHPLGPLIEYTGEKPLDPLTLLISLDDKGEASGLLYEDAGDGMEYLNGAYRLATYHARMAEGKIVVTSTAEGQLPAPARSVAVRVFWHEQEFAASGKEGEPISIPVPQ